MIFFFHSVHLFFFRALLLCAMLFARKICFDKISLHFFFCLTTTWLLFYSQVNQYHTEKNKLLRRIFDLFKKKLRKISCQNQIISFDQNGVMFKPNDLKTWHFYALVVILYQIVLIYEYFVIYLDISKRIHQRETQHNTIQNWILASGVASIKKERKAALIPLFVPTETKCKCSIYFYLI